MYVPLGYIIIVSYYVLWYNIMSNNTISIRVLPEHKTLLEKICRSRGEDMSDFIRRALLKELASLDYLTIEEKKALGV